MKTCYKNKRLEKGILIFAFLFILFHHFLGFGGHYGWDDMEYAQLSHQWATGNFFLSDNHFSYRWPIIVLSGISYKLFGVSDFSSSLPAMLISMLILFLVYWVVRKHDSRIVITAILTTLLMPPFLFYSDKIMSDIYVALGIFLSLVCLYLYRFEYHRYTFWFAMLFSCSLFFAFLSKETVVLLLPVLLILFIVDICQKKYLKFWMWAIISGLMLLLIYHVFIAYKTGNMFSRYTAINTNSYLNPCSYEYLPFINTLRRIGYEFWVEATIGMFLVTAGFLLSSLSKIKRFGFSKPDVFWVTIGLLLLLSANFMTKSYNAYSPMCTDIRHYLFLVPILTVAFAPAVVRFFYAEKKSWAVPVFSTLLFIIILANIKLISLNAIVIFYVCLVVLLWLIKLVKKVNATVSTILWIIFLMLWFIVPVTQMALDRKNSFSYIKPYIEKHFKKTSETAIVLTDPVMKRIADYYMHWDTSQVRFINERDYHIPYRYEAKQYYVYQNGLTWWMSKQTKPDPMLMWYLTEPYIIPVDSFKNNYLYRMAQPEKIWRPVTTHSFYNDMEWTYLPCFSFNCTSRDSLTVHSGNYAYKVMPQGFSPTLAMPLSSFITDYSTKIETEISAWIYAPTNQMTNIVFSIEDTVGKNVLWLGKPIKDIIKPAQQWQKVKMNASYLPAPDNKNFLLKIYLWNNDTSAIWVDDMRMDITVIDHL